MYGRTHENIVISNPVQEDLNGQQRERPQKIEPTHATQLVGEQRRDERERRHEERLDDWPHKWS